MKRPLGIALAVTLVCWLAYLATGTQASVEQEYYEAWAPIWLPEEGMQAMLLLNNNRGEEVAFELEAYDSGGALLDSVRVAAEPNASLSLPLGERLQGQRSGSVAIRYAPEFAADLPAQLLVHAPGVAANYLLSERRFHSTPDAAAAFWLPTPQARLYALLLNKSGNTVSVGLEIQTGKRRTLQDSFMLAPGMLMPLELRERYGLRAGEGSGAVRVTHSAKPGDVIAEGFVIDSRRGYSASLKWADAGFGSLSDTLILKHIKYGQHEEGFLAPHVTLANLGDSDAAVRPVLRLDGAEGLELQTRRLAPGEVQTVSLEPELRRLLGRSPVETVLELVYTGAPGSLAVSGVSVDRTLEHCYTSKVAGEAGLKQSYSYPFRSDGQWNTKIVVANRSAEPAGYSVFFFFDGQHYTYPTHHFLQPFEQRVIDVRQVREEQLSDDFGRTLPLEGPLAGQIKLFVHQGYVGKVVAQGVMESYAEGVSLSLSCDTCPPQPDRLVLLDSINGIPGQQARFNSHAGGPKRQIYPKLELSDGSSWFETGGVVDYDPTNGAVTRVDVGLSADFVEFLSAGQSEIHAQLDSCSWRKDFSTCEPQPGEFGACECECLPIVLTVPQSVGQLFSPSPPPLVTVTNPQLTIDEIDAIAKGGTRDVQITIPQGPLTVDVTLTLTTPSGSGSARFATNNSTILNVRQSAPVKLRGVEQSSTADNIRLQAKLGSSVLDTEDFSVIWVTLLPRTSGTVSTDNASLQTYKSLMGGTALGVFKSNGSGNRIWRTGVEIVGTVTPSNFVSGRFTMIRTIDESRFYDDMTEVVSLHVVNRPDTSDADLRDDNPAPNGRIYDLDAPGFSAMTSSGIARRRTNFTEVACFGVKIANGRLVCDQTVSDPLRWFSRMSIRLTPSGEVLQTDIAGDNRAGSGPTPLSANLQ